MLVKGFGSMNDHMGPGNAYNRFGVTLEGIYESISPFDRYERIKGKTIFTGDIYECIASTFIAGDYFGGSIKVFYAVYIAEAGSGAGNGPFVFFSRRQIFSHSTGDIFPDKNFFNRPVLMDSGTFFKYLTVHLARALHPFTNAVVDRPMPAADNIATMASKSSALVKCLQP